MTYAPTYNSVVFLIKTTNAKIESENEIINKKVEEFETYNIRGEYLDIFDIQEMINLLREIKELKIKITGLNDKVSTLKDLIA